MPKKVLVINGHGSKLPQKLQINDQHGIITPGNAGNSYVVSFVNQQRHLEEMTSQGKIWPIKDNQGKDIQWHRYRDTDINDISISPLQSGFDFSMFANGALKKNTQWENLSKPAHDVLDRGALAVKGTTGQIDILEGEQLKMYLQQGVQGTNQGVPLFFCDKELGKVKPMGNTSLSEIYTGVAMIKEFQASGTDVIVATCSPTNKKYDSVIVQTEHPATDLKHTPFVEISSPKAAYVLADVHGNNFVDSIEEKNGTYIINGRNTSGQFRSITIDQNGNATGFQGSKDLGAVGNQMFEQRAAIFAHFKIQAPDVVKGITTPATDKQHEIPKVVMTQKAAFVLIDNQGNNFVDSVEEKNGTYLIKGRNSSEEPRSITIDQNGNATGFQGSKELGWVGNQMFEQRAAIFAHFNIQVPNIVNGIRTQNVSSEKLIDAVSKSITDFGTQIQSAHESAEQKTLNADKENVFKGPD